MKLPHNKNAYIPEEKLTEYILSETHAVGKLKAKFFRAVGFDETNVLALKESLLSIASSQEVKDVIKSQHGIKYVLDGKIQTPNGRIVQLRTIWILELDQKTPRFVTVYPI